MSGGSIEHLRVVAAAEIRATLPMRDCVAVIDAAMRAVSAGEARLPLRFATPLDDRGNRLGVMHGTIARPAVFGAKLLALFPDNPRQGRSSHLGLITLFDGATGEPRAVLDAAAITALRTAAASAAATAVLARADAATLAIIGTGEQAEAHVEAMLAVRPIRTVRVWGRDQARAAQFAAHASARHGLPVRAAATIAEACREADIICTVTAARTPLFGPEMTHAGTHLNLVGASMPDAMEVEPALVPHCRYVVDHAPSAQAQARELILAIEQGLVPPDFVPPEIGAVLAGTAPGRTTDADVTAYRSLGIIAQDLAVAAEILARLDAA